MPTYIYRREDGTTFEIQQRITEDPLETCPETGQPVKRVISGSAGLIFKGDGFYLTDYARKAKGGDAKSSKAEGGKAKGGEAKKSEKKSVESKPGSDSSSSSSKEAA